MSRSMKTKYIFFVALLWLISMPLLSGQVQTNQKNMHQTFEIPDTITSVELDLYVNDKYRVESWAGNHILAETKVQLIEASEATLNFFVKMGRYKLEMEQTGKAIKLVSLDKERRSIRSRNSAEEASVEVVNVRIFLPKDFTQQSDTLWSKPEEETEQTDN